MIILDYLQLNPLYFVIVIGILSSCIGSFLNVVIWRLPRMMKHQWHTQCIDFLSNEENYSIEALKSAQPCDPPQWPKPYNLMLPHSHCPKCAHPISWWENIPVVSYLLLKGRCRKCQHAISLRYPLIELFTALVGMIVAWHFGWSWHTVGALIFSYMLIVLSVIDMDHQILPDEITLLGIWVGLGFSLTGLFCTPQEAIIGAGAGYLILWGLYWAFKWLTGKEGMGYGDFKLLALIGAFCGWQALFLVIILSSFLGAAVGLTQIALGRLKRTTPIPFGPYLAIGGWVALMWLDPIQSLYFQYGLGV